MDTHSIITGGAGFIGSHLAERLTAAGHRLTLVDDLSTGQRSNIQHLLGDRCKLVEACAAEALTAPGFLDSADRVFHLAAAVGVKLVVDDPSAMIRNNIEQTDAVLHAAAEARVPVLLTSSSEVYGKCPVLPLHEDMELVYGPTTASRWSYGLTKALDEHLALDLARRASLDTVVVRLFNTIGPRQIGRYGMVVPRFVAQAAAGQDLTLYGDGKQTRAFCDVRDVAAALHQLLETPDAYGRVFNVGSTSPITIDTLADRVQQAAEYAGFAPVGKTYLPYEAAYGQGFEDPPHRLPDITRLEDTIGFTPQIALEQTLAELFADAARRNNSATSTLSTEERL
ncbi:MAG: NAD-dependent epimerase/dehydratase family protein [Planctomycetota bacterium]